jgi:hypothetical protein
MSRERLLGLHWAIKASFLGYIGRMADGRATATDGATPTEGNIMVFEPATVPVPSEAADADLFFAFRGDIRFAGHFGMLFVRIADPWIAVHGDRGVMWVLDPYKPDEKPRVPLVRFTLESRPTADDLQIWLSTDVQLTAEGTALFNDVYQAGEAFEPLAIFLAGEAAATSS